MAKILEVTDLNAPELDLFCRLTEAQLLDRRGPGPGRFIAESPEVIRQALKAGCRPLAFLMERRHIEGKAKELIDLCGDLPVHTGERAVLGQLTGYELTRGILCALERPEAADWRGVCAGARRLAVLEGIVDPTNLGAIFRSAAALGMDGVLLSPDCCDPLHRRALRVSMGTVFQIPWARLGAAKDWPGTSLSQLGELGFRRAALALGEDALDVQDPRLASAQRLALLLGTEGSGLRTETVAACDWAVKIPMAHGVDSLNVAAAAAVAFWQLR